MLRWGDTSTQKNELPSSTTDRHAPLTLADPTTTSASAVLGASMISRFVVPVTVGVAAQSLFAARRVVAGLGPGV